MSSYIQVPLDDGTSVLVEVTEEELSADGGVKKAGLRDMVNKQVAEAQTSLNEAFQHMLSANVHAFIQAVQRVPTMPIEAEMTFGLKFTGQAGNVVIAQAGGEVNYTIRLLWRREAKIPDAH
jgi:hypothetical protein